MRHVFVQCVHVYTCTRKFRDSRSFSSRFVCQSIGQSMHAVATQCSSHQISMFSVFLDKHFDSAFDGRLADSRVPLAAAMRLWRISHISRPICRRFAHDDHGTAPSGYKKKAINNITNTRTFDLSYEFAAADAASPTR